MARLNELHGQQSESIEALKRRYQRQNRDLAKSNANQSALIQSLQNELVEMSSENLRLNSEVIHLRGQVDRMKGHTCMDELARTREMMNDKISELTSIVNGLGNLRPRKSVAEKRMPKAIKPDESMRIRPEGLLPDIKERRTSQNFDENATSPALHRHDAEQARLFNTVEQSPVKSTNSMLDVRPRRRKDPSFSENSTTLAPITTETLKGQAKRKALDFTSPLVVGSSLTDEFGNLDIASSEDEAEIELEGNNTIPVPKTSNKSTDDTLASLEPILPPQKLSASGKSDTVPTPHAEYQRAAHSPRRVLEPKSANSDISSSPRRLGYAKSLDYIKQEHTEKPLAGIPLKRSITPTTDAENRLDQTVPIEIDSSNHPRQASKVKPHRLSSTRRDSAISEDGAELEGSLPAERARRTRGTAVNYALPPLNKKLRRESELLVDAVEGNTKSKKLPSDKSKGSKEGTSPGVAIKSEPSEDNEKPIYNENGDHDLLKEAKIPSTTTISRKRRTSTLYEAIPDDCGLAAFNDENANKNDKSRMDAARRDIRGYTMAPSPEPSRTTIKGSSSTLFTTSSLERNSTGSLGATTSATNKRKSSIRVMADSVASDSVKNQPSGPVVPASELLEVRRQRRATLAVTSAADGVNSNVGATSNSRRADSKPSKLNLPTAFDSDAIKANRRKTMVI